MNVYREFPGGEPQVTVEKQTLYNMKTDVLIVGAGPTGLMTASQLSRYGVKFMIIDKKDGPTKESRAIGVTPRSLEIYQQMGLADVVLNEGAPMKGILAWSNGRKKAEVNFGALGKELTDFHYLYGFEQNKNEELLYQYIKEHSHEVYWGTALQSLTHSERGIEATTFSENQTGRIECKYLIGCDGAKSLVRQQLGFQFNGGTYQNKFFVADTNLEWELGNDRLIISPATKVFCAFFPLKGRGNYRVIGTLPKSFFNKSDITFSDAEPFIQKNIGIAIKFKKVNWFSVYLLHHRAVDTFRKGDIFLAGDSAHIHSPAGAQGMNTGLQDAYNLAWKLAFVLKGYADKKLLDTYNEERLPIAEWLLKFTDRGFGIMSSDNPLLIFFRKHFALNLLKYLLKIDWLKRRMFGTVAQLRYSYAKMTIARNYSKQKLKFGAGERLPYLGTGFYEQFSLPCFYCIHIGSKPLDNPVAEKLKKSYPFPVTLLESPLHNWNKVGVKKELFVLVRPDNYIALIADEWEDVLTYQMTE